ncbi:MAG: TIGR03086 family metal-binding protein [Nocardioidaceae bacterium]
MTTTQTDLRPALAASLDQVGRLIETTDPADAARPTPCADWDVAGLVSHLLAVVRRIGVVLDGRPFWSVPRQLESDDWAATWTSERATTDAVLGDDTLLAREVQVPWGTVTGRQAIGSYIGELTTHAWDLAVATDRTSTLDPALAEAALPGAMAKIPAEPRGGEIPFGPVVETGPDATAYERLVAWEGRDPAWRG